MEHASREGSIGTKSTDKEIYSRIGILHCVPDDVPDPFCHLDEMIVGEMGVARRGPVPTVAKQLADQRQVLTGHHGLTGRRVLQVMQAQPAELRFVADRPPAGGEAVLPAAFGVARKQERIGVACTGKRADVRPLRSPR